MNDALGLDLTLVAAIYLHLHFTLTVILGLSVPVEDHNPLMWKLMVCFLMETKQKLTEV